MTKTIGESLSQPQAGDDNSASGDHAGSNSRPFDSARGASDRRNAIVSPVLGPCARPEGVHFPGSLCCCTSDAPSADGVYFNIHDGTVIQNPQAFGYAELCKHISTTGYYDSYRNVRHPAYEGFSIKRFFGLE